jgi:hypothetical protein
MQADESARTVSSSVLTQGLVYMPMAYMQGKPESEHTVER